MIANAVIDIWRGEGIDPIFKYEDDLAIFRTPVIHGLFSGNNGFNYDYDKCNMLLRIAPLGVP